MSTIMPQVSFSSNEEIDLAFLLSSLSPKSLIHQSRQDISRKLETLAQNYERFAEKSSLYSQRDGLLKHHFLCASLVDSQGSIFSDVNKKYENLLAAFRTLIASGKGFYSATKQMSDLGDFVSVWKKRCFSLENVQEIARISFRLPKYSVFILLSLSGKFGMPCMTHDKYIFVNAQKGEERFIVNATFHELLHQLLLGYRYSTEGKFFVGRFLWQPRRMMIEEIVLACLQMELYEDLEKRKEERERVLHLDRHLRFLKPFKPLFPKILRDWEENYMSSQNMNLQKFVDKCARKYLKPLKFISLMRHIDSEKPLRL